ncbi:MAG: hypothetical protein PHF74_01615 [Dehalococcoidales bacterium]|nr:hypothetical protein [Dehalococcoidales bacterium]
MNQVRKVQIGVLLTIAISMVIVLCTPSTVVPAKAGEMGQNEIMEINDFSGIPREVIDDAVSRAATLFGKNEGKCSDFVSQVLALYEEAKEIDVLVIVNSGGWGWSAIAESNEKELAPGIDGILTELGNATLWIDYFRTDNSFFGAIGEFMMAMSTNPARGQELAFRTEFLTDNLPDLKVILLGISNGCTICSGAMPLLAENEQVYSIQLGPPVWNNNSHMERVLLLRTNGTIPDSFSHGDLLTIFRANMESACGISQEYEGDILLYIGAPGHDYDWKYDWLKLQINNFLNEYFSKN